MHQIEVLDIHDGFSKNFHPQGLFSIEIFGKPGEEKRNRLFAYIDLHIPIIHPVLFKAISDLKELYRDVLAGKKYAVFDEVIQDLVESDISSGHTGYKFFMEHIKKIKFEERESPSRTFNIKLVYKYINTLTLDKLLVLPAGLRDYVVDPSGKPSEDEINVLYRKVLSLASMISNVNVSENLEYLDSPRFNLQLAVNDIYDYIKNLLEGKSKLILGSWASRNIFFSTRNVITSIVPEVKELHDIRDITVNHSVIGLYQTMGGTLPLAISLIRDTYLTSIFSGPNTPALLVDKKTLNKKMVTISSRTYDEWMTYEGLEKKIARFEIEELRHSEIEIEDHYLGLLYDGPEGYLFLQDIEDLPMGLDPKNVKGISYAELYYMSVCKRYERLPHLFTRYPITGYGSIYPAWTYVRTTIKANIRNELDSSGQPTGYIAKEFPIRGQRFFNSMSPAKNHLGRLGA